LLEHHHEPADVYRYYRAADLCYVGSLRDGMNLVAKEFVSARSDERGVLVLSQFAGAAQQLRAALQVNPLRIEQTADTLAHAFAMAPVEQSKRMRQLRANVQSFDASWWARQMVEDAAKTIARSAFEFDDPVGSSGEKESRSLSGNPIRPDAGFESNDLRVPFAATQ
jgi:trehalose 6-phosphate synthase